MPKQFYPLINGKSLFEKTVLRNMGVCSSVLLATNIDQYLLATDQLLAHNIKESGGVIEPCGRNTAPAIALVCKGLDKESLVLATPPDQLISNKKAYEVVLSRGVELSISGSLATFGFKPTF